MTSAEFARTVTKIDEQITTGKLNSLAKIREAVFAEFSNDMSAYENNILMDSALSAYIIHCSVYGIIPTVGYNRYATCDRETGTIIDYFDTLAAAQRAIDKYEAQDKEEGTFTPNFYDIKEMEEETDEETDH